MGSDESHFNVSVGSDGQSPKTLSTNHNLFEEKGEPKRYRTKVLPLTSLTPYRYAKPAHAVNHTVTYTLNQCMGARAHPRHHLPIKQEGLWWYPSELKSCAKIEVGSQ